MTRWLFALAIPTFCLLVSANAYGQERTEGKRMIRPAGELMGLDIRSKNSNESLGHIEDFVVNLKDGKIVYVAMARGQVLGFGGSMFAVSPDALTMAANGEYCILNASNQEFENAKGFDLNAWPSLPDRRWGKAGAANANDRDQVRDNDRPAGTVKSNENLSRLSAINGLYVYGKNDKSVGRIYDCAIDCNKHQIAFAAVHHGGALGVGGKLVAVPWQALTMKAPALDPQRRAFYINATENDFERATGFTSDRWPEQPEAAFRNLTSGAATDANRRDN